MIKDILRNVKVTTLTNSKITEPSIIIEGSENTLGGKIYTMNKSFIKSLYSKLGLSKQLSNNVFKLDKDLWKKVIDIKYSEVDKDIFDLTNLRCLEYNGMLVDNITDFKNIEDSEYYNNVVDLINIMDKFDVHEEITSNVSNTTRIYLKNEDSNVLFIVEMNLSGQYSLYKGFKRNSMIYIYNNPIIYSTSLMSFLSSITKDDFLESEYSIPVIVPELNIDTQLSVRELLDFIKYIKADVDIDEDTGLISSISGLNSKDSDLIVNSLNTFMIPFKSLRKMKFIKKSLKLTVVTFRDILEIICRNYHDPNLDISSDTIAYICQSCSSDECDSLCIKTERV